jgi:stage III sporulation protein AA
MRRQADRSTGGCHIPYREVAAYLPSRIRECIEPLPERVLADVEEIRIRQGRPLQLCFSSGSAFVARGLGLVETGGSAYMVTEDDVVQLLNLLSRSSLYAFEEELRRGYITLAGGHRVGIAGRAVLGGGEVRTMKEITCFNIRCARQIPGIASPYARYLVDPRTLQLHNTLIVSPPQCGKTTLLRDLIRQLSDGVFHQRLAGLKVGVVDERSELAGCVSGIPSFDIGTQTDVLDACPKAEGMMMMIRSMSPHVLVTDEIGREEDRLAILEAVYAGVRVITSAHSYSMQEVKQRPVLRALFDEGIFTRCVVLSRRRGPATLEGVYDASGRLIS